MASLAATAAPPSAAAARRVSSSATAGSLRPLPAAPRPLAARRLPAAAAPAHRCTGRVVFAAAAAGASNGAAAAKSDKRLKPFSNTNKFLVPQKCQFQFELEWKKREQDMNLYTGFEGLTISRNGDEYTTTSKWATIYDWEDWSSGIHHRRSHLPVGVSQYPPAKGTGFPETFVPLIGLTDKPMMAQY
eukprot:jgi/Tetstr1/457657/TSEL_004238.t1